MANHPQNQEIGARGGDIDLDVYFREYAGGNLVDPDTPPTFKIYDPQNTEVSSGTGVRTSLGYWHTIYSIGALAEISDEWKIEWSATINGSAIISSEFFRVVDSGQITFGHQVLINDEWLYQIKKVLAYPKVENIILTDAEIKSFCVFPALQEYFIKFPIKVPVQQNIMGELAIDFPDEYTYGVTDVRIVDKGNVSGTDASFWEIVNFQNLGLGKGTSDQYGSKYNFNNIRQTQFMRRQVQRSIENTATTKYRIDEVNKQVIAYSSVSSKLDITWAKWSNNFDDVKYARKFDVIELAQAHLLYHLADTSDIIEDTGADQRVNADSLKSRAEELFAKIREKWLEFTDIIVLRGT